MDPIVTPILVIVGATIALVWKGNKDEKKAEAETHVQPTFAPAALATLVDGSVTAKNEPIQSFKPAIAKLLLESLGHQSLSAMTLTAEDGTALAPNLSAPLFKIVPGAGDLSVADAAVTAQKSGSVVLASLTLALPDSEADKLLMIVDPGDRHLAGAGGDFAILLDVGPPALDPGGPHVTPPASSTGPNPVPAKAVAGAPEVKNAERPTATATAAAAAKSVKGAKAKGPTHVLGKVAGRAPAVAKKPASKKPRASAASSMTSPPSSASVPSAASLVSPTPAQPTEKVTLTNGAGAPHPHPAAGKDEAHGVA